jgi:hypothetical protein
VTAPAQDFSREILEEEPEIVSAARDAARVGNGRIGAAGNEERSMAGYGGVDFIDFDSQLNDEEKLVRQTWGTASN